jgi:hypothetical protein
MTSSTITLVLLTELPLGAIAHNKGATFIFRRNYPKIVGKDNFYILSRRTDSSHNGNNKNPYRRHNRTAQQRKAEAILRDTRLSKWQSWKFKFSVI